MGNPAHPAGKTGAFPLIRALVAAGLVSLMAAPAVAECAKPEAVAAPKGEQAFTQTRILKGLKRPIVSTGSVLVQGETVVWTVKEPIEIITRITKTGVTQSVDGGAPEPLGPEGSDAVLVQSGLMDLLKGQLSALDTRYSVKRAARTKGDGWKLDMTPKAEQLKGWIAGLEVEGCTRIETVSIRQANGDVMNVALAAPAG